MNLTLEQLATLLGTTKSYLSRIENNRIERPGVDILKKLSKQLDIDYNTLMIYSGYIESTKQSKADFNLPNDLRSEERRVGNEYRSLSTVQEYEKDIE